MKTNTIVGWMVVNRNGDDCSTLLKTRATARWLKRNMAKKFEKNYFKLCKVQVVH